MLPVFLACAAWAAALLGLGHQVARLLAPRADPGTTGLLGLLALAAAGTALHLVLPVGPAAAAIALLLGLAAFGWRAREIVAGATPAGALGLLAWLAVLSALTGYPPRHYDMGLYWLQAVRWTTESAQVPGLATLHGRLGLNSAWFPAAALLEHPLAVGKSAFLATTLVLFFAGWLAADGLRRATRGEADLGSLLAASGALPIAAALGQLGGHSPDAAAAVAAFAALVGWARALARPDALAPHAAAAALLSLFAFTIKASYLVLPAASALLLLAHRRDLPRRAALALAAAAGVLVVPWLAHGLLASGCPVFPSRVACLPVAWATPASIADDLSGWVRAWAREPGRPWAELEGRWDWVAGWGATALASRTVQALLATLGGSVVALALLAAGGHGRPGRGFWAVWATAAAASAFWFWLAPTPRFGWGALCGLALVPAAQASAALLRRWPRRAVAAGLGVLLLAASAWILPESLRWLGRARPGSTPFATWPPMPVPATVERETLPGWRVRVPLEEDLCWDEPLPCTPYFDPGLARDGFIRTYTRAPVHP